MDEAAEAPPEALAVPGLYPVQLLFLEHYRLHGLVTAACEATEIPQSSVARWRKQPAFAAAFAEAEEVYRDAIRREIHRRAIDGWEDPVYQRGERVGYVRRYSDALLVALAKTRMPEFRDKEQASVNVQNNVQVVAWRERRLPDAHPAVIEVVVRGDDGNSESPQLGACAL